jgi:predicted phage baseplate assembly protein
MLLQRPDLIRGNATQKRWQLRTLQGFTGSLDATDDQFEFSAPLKEDPLVSELAEIKALGFADGRHTSIQLADNLRNVFDINTVEVYANVAPATHGETVQEVLGGGDAARPFQQFGLKQPPLTYVSAAGASGAQSTLTVRVNDILWNEADSFYARRPDERIYVTRQEENGGTTVVFGDGKTGARLPTSAENVRAAYRKGIGRAGNLREGQLSLLMSRPLGVNGVTNPVPATGGADPETVEFARRAIPFTVTTLGRVVSVQDYEDFARSFAGIGKSLATWTWDGSQRGIYVTVAGMDGADVPVESKTFTSLLKALRGAGDPLVPLTVASYLKATFKVAGTVFLDPAYEPARVLKAVEQTLRARFTFDARAFGQPVFQSEVVSAIQSVNGVVSLDLSALYRTDRQPSAEPEEVLVAYIPRHGDDGISPAELLLLDPGPLGLEATI